MPPSRRPSTLDHTLARIMAFNDAKGGGVAIRKGGGGYSLFREDTGAPVARLQPRNPGDRFEVLYWSYRDRWDPVGTFGTVLPLDEALEYIAEDPEGCFWR